jgi:ATP-dependent Zn protease
MKDPHSVKSGADDKNLMPKWAIWAVVAAVAGLVLGSQLFANTAGDRLTYTEFLVQVKNGDVEQVVINNSSNTSQRRISGTLKSGAKFYTVRKEEFSIADEELLKQMGVDYSFKTPQADFFTSLLPVALSFAFVIAFFVWMQRRARRG